jgi:putative transposase
VNHKRTYRLYCEEDLAVRRKRPRKRLSHLRVTPLAPTGPNQRWSMDFVADSLHDGRKFRILTVMDVFTRECLWSRNLRVSVATARPEHSRNRRST